MTSSSSARATRPTVLSDAIDMVPVSVLKTHPENPRMGDLSVISESISAHGFYGVLIVQRSTNYILAGNHRARAAIELGMTELPVQYVDVDDDKARRILLVDNRSNDRAGFDNDRLLALLTDLDTLDGTGYVPEDISALQALLTPTATTQNSTEASDNEPGPYHAEGHSLRIYIGPLCEVNVKIVGGHIDAKELRKQLAAVFEKRPDWNAGFDPQPELA